MRFHPWSLPTVGIVGGERQSITPGYLLEAGSNAGKRVRLTNKTRPGDTFHGIPDQGHPTPRRWKRLRSPSSEGVGGEVGVPRNLFPRLGELGDFALGDAWNLPSEGTEVGVSPAGQSSRRDQCTGTGPF